MMGRFPYQGLMAIPTEEDCRIVQEALMLTELQDLGERKMTTLSGGEQQLVFLAGAVAQQTPILLLDEPTTFLDPYHQQLICRVLDRIRRKFDTAIISITHEVTSFTTQYDNVLALKDGSILYCGSVNDLLAKGPGILDQIFDIPFEVATTASGQKAIVPKAGL
jgi:iron complex transport system ATP-binding protein